MNASQSLKASISARGAPLCKSFASVSPNGEESLPLQFTSIPCASDISMPAAGWNGEKLAP